MWRILLYAYDNYCQTGSRKFARLECKKALGLDGNTMSYCLHKMWRQHGFVVDRKTPGCYKITQKGVEQAKLLKQYNTALKLLETGSISQVILDMGVSEKFVNRSIKRWLVMAASSVQME